jgi:hypothetical protein
LLAEYVDRVGEKARKLMIHRNVDMSALVPCAEMQPGMSCMASRRGRRVVGESGGLTRAGAKPRAFPKR